MLLVNDEDGLAGPILAQFIIDVVFAPVVLLLESQAAQIRTLYFPHWLESTLPAWTSWHFLGTSSA